MPNRMGKVLQGGGMQRGQGPGGKVYRQQAPLRTKAPKQNVAQGGVPDSASRAMRNQTGLKYAMKKRMKQIFLDRINTGLPNSLFQGERQDYLRGLQGGRSNLQSMLARSGDQTGFAPAAALGFENAGALGLSQMGFQQRKMQYEDPLEQVLRWRQSKHGGGRADSPSMGPDIGGMLQGVGAIAQGVGSFTGNQQLPQQQAYSNDFMGPLPQGGYRVGG